MHNFPPHLSGDLTLPQAQNILTIEHARFVFAWTANSCIAVLSVFQQSVKELKTSVKEVMFSSAFVCLFVCLCVYLSVCLSLCLSICLFVC